MFESIEFITTKSSHHLTSNKLSKVSINKDIYDEENLLNSNFDISGSVDSFQKPPITDFAINNLYYMQAFDIFHYNCGSFTERKNFHSFLILYTYSGKGTLYYNNKNYTLTEGDGFLINCMDYHLYKAESQSWDTGILHIGGPLLPSFHEQYLQSESPIFHEPVVGKFQQYLENILSLYSTFQLYRDWQVSTCIDNLLNHLLLLNFKNASENVQKIPENLHKLIKYMNENYNKHITLNNLAEFSHVTKFYLSREFKKYTGFSPNDYLISLRINQAKMLLKSTSLPACKIAHNVGIHDMNNFTNLFKKKTGITPLQFRNSNKIFS